MECIVLAGGRPGVGDPLWAETRGAQKAWIDLAGRPMIRRVVDALAVSRHIDRIIIVGLDQPLEQPLESRVAIELLGDQGSLTANLYAGIARLTPGQPAAYCWSDLPLLTGPMIDRFVEQTPDPNLDLNVGLVARSQLEARYPGVDDLWLRVREGSFIAADFGMFHPANAARARRHFEALMLQRKSAARQALYVGAPLLVRYVLGRLTIPGLEAHLRRRFGLACHVRVIDDPELGLDVDNAANLAVCRRALAARHDGLPRGEAAGA